MYYTGIIPEARPLPPIKVPVNLYLSDGRNGIHYDTFKSDETNGPGPAGLDSNLVTRKLDILAEERLPGKYNIHIFKRNENDASGG